MPGELSKKMTDDEKEIREAIALFYSSLNAMLAGDPEPAKKLWSHADDVTYMGAAGGFRIGWNQVYADWKSQGDMKQGGKVEPSHIRITIGQDIAITQNSTRGEVKNEEGEWQKTELRETSVFRKEDGKWKMIGHHADALHFLVKWRADMHPKFTEAHRDPQTVISPNASLASLDDEEAVFEAVEQFYAALNTMFTGDLGPMKGVWSHADDVTYMGPGGGIQVGWDQVHADWEAQAAMKLGGEVRPEEITITLGSDIAIVNNYERGENTNVEGKPEKVSIRVTKVFRKSDGQWKIIGIHADPLPFLEK